LAASSALTAASTAFCASISAAFLVASSFEAIAAALALRADSAASFALVSAARAAASLALAAAVIASLAFSSALAATLALTSASGSASF